MEVEVLWEQNFLEKNGYLYNELGVPVTLC